MRTQVENSPMCEQKILYICTIQKGKCRDCEDLPPKCTTNGNILNFVF